jgi:hypothetical protein
MMMTDAGEAGAGRKSCTLGHEFEIQFREGDWIF